MNVAIDGGWPELDRANDNTLAWLANRLTDAERGATWPSRDAATRAILDAHEGMPEKDPRSDLLHRFFRGGNWRPDA